MMNSKEKTNLEIIPEAVPKAAADHTILQESRQTFDPDRTLYIGKDSPDYAQWIGWASILIKTVQDVSELKPGVKYLAEVPMKYKAGVESGIYKIMQNSKTGILRPSIVDANTNRIVGPMELVKKVALPSQAVPQLCQDLYAAAILVEITQIAEHLKEIKSNLQTLEKEMKAEFRVDREGQILSGISQIQRSLQIKDSTDRKNLLALGQNNLEVGITRIGCLLQKKCREYTPVSGTPLQRIITSLTVDSNFHQNRLREYNEIQRLDSQYITGRRLLSWTYAITGDQNMADLVIDQTFDFLDGIDTHRILSLKKLPRVKSMRLFPDSWKDRLNDQREENRQIAPHYDTVAIEYDSEVLEWSTNSKD